MSVSAIKRKIKWALFALPLLLPLPPGVASATTPGAIITPDNSVSSHCEHTTNVRINWFEIGPSVRYIVPIATAPTTPIVFSFRWTEEPLYSLYSYMHIKFFLFVVFDPTGFYNCFFFFVDHRSYLVLFNNINNKNNNNKKNVLDNVDQIYNECRLNINGNRWIWKIASHNYSGFYFKYEEDF